jgi:hypothetical protein
LYFVPILQFKSFFNWLIDWLIDLFMFLWSTAGTLSGQEI